MISGCGLIIDYTLMIALSIASGADAVFSFLPAEFIPWKIYVTVGGVIVPTALNMRGVKESVVPLIPVFMVFIFSHLFAIAYVLLKRLDSLVEVSQVSLQHKDGTGAGTPVAFDQSKKTAIILVSGFNGLGLHTLFGVVRLFGATFKNYIFVQVGVIDAGNFKGPTELEHLKSHINGELDRYVSYMQQQGCYAEGRSGVGTDAVQCLSDLVPEILEKYPQGICFAGQLVFPEETSFTRLLHNYVVFSVQRRLYSRGIPFVILPIRV